MRNISNAGIIFALFCLVSALAGIGAKAQTIYSGVQDVALKSGESAELAQVYFIGASCQSLLKGTPDVEILDGPPSVTASIREEKVVPRDYGCANPVPGGKLVISAGRIEDYSRTRMVLRVKFKTSLGDRQVSRDVNLSLFP
jgi:hypothetical protein